ncbi:MAG: DEAD/DEAH box helicase family protein, partial [Methanosarcinales archaeon]
VEKLRRNRRQPEFNLKYFQYLAVLFTEIFLDKYYNDKDRFLNELNLFLEEFNNQNKTSISPFTEDDLKKLAFWMATGSGKTLIMHINYWQILKYSNNRWDNIIMITPNEGLSKQHYDEMILSGIQCKLYDGNIDCLKTKEKEVLIIDIHKLTGRSQARSPTLQARSTLPSVAKEKKGEGVSVDVSFFDGKNLVFIDEGHKGQKSEEQRWKKLREEIGKNGFIFEYSATFGQVIGKNKDLLEEYAKAILFDYSYKYFYTDGYGKDFYVYNLKEDAYAESHRDLLLTASLLSYYEQLLIFENHYEELREYNIEKPLWIFVGSKVSGKGLGSDVVKVIQFIDKTLKDKKYLEYNIKKILSGKSGLIDKEGNDIFKGKFEFIREKSFTMDEIYQKIFNGKGTIELYEIKNAEGELSLKTSLGEKYFGVVNVGDVASLKKLIKESKIEVKEDHFSNSLFLDINENNSSINLLIGSKKFIEGWNSWRVSNMGLINMGKGEGPQIIQLFGRGVRLKGRVYSLKRDENPSYWLKTVQTLNIFGLNANYINAFLETLEKEEVDYEEIAIPIRFNMPDKWENKIYTIRTKDEFDFLEHPLLLTIDENILRNIRIDITPKITLAHGFARGSEASTMLTTRYGYRYNVSWISSVRKLKVGGVDTASEESLVIPEEHFDLIDWDYIYLNIIAYKMAKGFYNLLIEKKTLRKIIESKKYKLYALPEQIKVSRFEDINKIHSITEMIIKEYISLFYRQAEKKKTMEYLMVENLTKEDENLNFGNIILKISKTIAKEFKNLLMDLEKIYKVDIEEIPTIQYDAIKPKFGNGNHSKEEIEIILRRYLKK